MNITGIILAGGKSSRMGQNKSLLKLGSLTLIEVILQKMKSFFAEVIIIQTLLKIMNFCIFHYIRTLPSPRSAVRIHWDWLTVELMLIFLFLRFTMFHVRVIKTML
jgi:NDP-sugar pyrophosphorylase family protein